MVIVHSTLYVLKEEKPVKKWLSIFLIICCMTSLAACGKQEEPTGQTIQLYYISNSETKVEVRDYVLTTETFEEQLEEVLAALADVPDKLEYKAPLAMGFQVKGHRNVNGALTLNMDSKYTELIPTTEVLVRAAIVCTMVQLSDVSSVSFTVEGNPLYDNLGSLVGVMTADQFINNMGSEISAYDTVNLTLYFTNETGDGLIAVNREKAYNTNISLDRLVVEELIAGPSATVEGVYPTINPNTKPISVLTKDGICYVNLDETFFVQVYNVTPDVTIYSIVNSLAELSNVNKVQISINGDTSKMYREKYSFSTVFERNLDLITTLKK